MIKSISIRNFFSFGEDCHISLNSDTNILLGINGSGKSNFIKALMLLREAIVGEKGFEYLFMQKWGGFGGIAFAAKEHMEVIQIVVELHHDVWKFVNPKEYRGQDIIYNLSIHNIGSVNYRLSEKIFQIHSDGKREALMLQRSEYAVLKNFQSGISERVDTANLSMGELVSSRINNLLLYPYIHVIRQAFEQISIYSYFDTTENSIIRQLSPYYSAKRLLPNGENLTSLLSYLNGNRVSAFDKIASELRNINPNFRELVFTTPTAGKTLLSLKEKGLERAITIEQISDGTLRFLILLSILYNPQRGSVVCIDEPETGLHPDMIQTIARGIQYAAETGTQMIVATHSPLLLNAFELENIKVFEKDASNQTIVLTKSEEDFPDWEGAFLPGQMWLRGLIGGKRW